MNNRDNYTKTALEESLTKEYNHEIKIKSDKDIAREMQDIKNEAKEIFVAFHLDTKNQIISREIVSIGTLNSSLIHPREVFRGAIIDSANSIIIAHNHPSGNTTPSEEDKTVTKNLMKAGELLGIPVLDHIIVGIKDEYTSMKSKGMM